MYKIFIGLSLAISVHSTALTMEQPRVSTPEVGRRRIAAITTELNQLGRKYVHVMGTDKEHGLKTEIAGLELEKSALTKRFAISHVDEDDEPTMRKISVKQKCDTLREVFTEPVYPPVSLMPEEIDTPSSDGSSPVQSEASETVASSFEHDQTDPQFTPDSANGSKMETLAQQKKLFSSIVAAKKQVQSHTRKPSQQKNAKKKPAFAEQEDPFENMFNFDDMPPVAAKPTKKGRPIPKSPVTPLHVAQLYKKARFGSV